jgi:hypothetical protein
MQKILNLELPEYNKNVKVYRPYNNLRNLRNDAENYVDDIEKLGGYKFEIKYLNGVVIENNKYFISDSYGKFSDGYGVLNTSISELDHFFLVEENGTEFSFRCFNLFLEIRNSHLVSVIFDSQELILGVINHSIRKKFLCPKTIKKSFNFDNDYPDNIILEIFNFSDFQ